MAAPYMQRSPAFVLATQCEASRDSPDESEIASFWTYIFLDYFDRQLFSSEMRRTPPGSTPCAMFHFVRRIRISASGMQAAPVLVLEACENGGSARDPVCAPSPTVVEFAKGLLRDGGCDDMYILSAVGRFIRFYRVSSVAPEAEALGPNPSRSGKAALDFEEDSASIHEMFLRIQADGLHRL